MIYKFPVLDASNLNIGAVIKGAKDYANVEWYNKKYSFI